MEGEVSACLRFVVYYGLGSPRREEQAWERPLGTTKFGRRTSSLPLSISIDFKWGQNGRASPPLSSRERLRRRVWSHAGPSLVGWCSALQTPSIANFIHRECVRATRVYGSRTFAEPLYLFEYFDILRWAFRVMSSLRVFQVNCLLSHFWSGSLPKEGTHVTSCS